MLVIELGGWLAIRSAAIAAAAELAGMLVVALKLGGDRWRVELTGVRRGSSARTWLAGSSAPPWVHRRRRRRARHAHRSVNGATAAAAARAFLEVRPGSPAVEMARFRRRGRGADLGFHDLMPPDCLYSTRLARD